MTRLYIAAALVLVLLVAAWAIYNAGARHASDRAERDALQSTIDSGEQFNEGADNPGTCGWFDRLREACPAD